jgi:ferredoxin
VTQKTKRRPVIDLGACVKCGGCIEVAPEVFFYNEAGGYFEVAELRSYDIELVDEAIKLCPADCIGWEGEP